MYYLSTIYFLFKLFVVSVIEIDLYTYILNIFLIYILLLPFDILGKKLR